MKIQWLGVQGTLSAAISDVDVTISSAGLADLPEVVAPDYAKLVIDPAGSDGRPEVVYVTAHAAAATTATISRGEETEEGGSVARSHADGAIWYHAATPRDYEGMMVAADETERESLSVEDGTVVWQQDTMEHWTYVDAATPYWTRNNTYHQFIYNSSGIQGNNRYNNWSDLMTDIASEEGSRIILFEQNETIPAGAWNLDNVELRGNSIEYDQGGFTLTFGDSTTISSWENPRITGIRLLSTSATGPIWSPTGALVFAMTNTSHVHATTEPFIEHSGGGQMILSLDSGARWRLLSGGVEMLHDTSSAFGCTLIVSRGKGATVENDTISSDNAVIFIDVVQDTNNDVVTSGFPSTHTNLVIGFGLPLYLTDANALGFDPTGLAIVTSDQTQEAIAELDAATDAVTTDVAALPLLDSGTYTPTLTDVANVSSSTSYDARWIRIGNQIQVVGRCAIDPTSATTLTRWRVSLPVASDFASDNDAAGVAVGDLSDESAAHGFADTANDEIEFSAYPVDIAQHVYSFSFMYTVI